MRYLFYIYFIFQISMLNAGWHDKKCEGWAYFEDNKNEKKQIEEKPQKSPSELLAESKKKMEDMFAKAALDPTEENILDYLEFQNKWLKRAGEVSRVWAKVILQNPELDNSFSGNPISSYGTKFYHKQKALKQKELIKNLAKSHSLLCFYEGKNEGSKEFAKVIQLFSKRHNWIVQPISVDEVIIDNFPSSILDNGLRETMEVDHFPAVYVFDSENGYSKPVGFGLVSVDMIESNISLQFTED